MILTTAQEDKTRKKFRRTLRNYVRDNNTRCMPVKRSTPKRGTRKLGEMVQIAEDDVIHVFNNEAMLAISHAIEDLASEIREGELIATFQKIGNFMHQKKRYVGLAKDLDAVRVWAEGVPPKGCSRIDFIRIFKPELAKYWVVLFASSKANAVLVCRQVNNTDDFQEKVFAGFYSFNPFLVESVRRHFNLVSCGLESIVRRWESELHLPSISLREIDRLMVEPKS